MADGKKFSYSINLSFTPISLPPLTDILVLAKKFPSGKTGVTKAFKLIAPDEFEMFELNEDPVIDAVLINKRILKKLDQDIIIDTLKKTVFPHVSKGEAIKVDFSVVIQYEQVKGSR